MPGAIRIGNPAIEVRLRRNARARRMVLRVGSSGRTPTLTLPPGVPLAHARAFLDDHQDWLRRHVAAGAARAPIGEGSVLPFGAGTLTVRAHDGRTTLRAGDSAGGTEGRAADEGAVDGGAVLAIGGRPGPLGPRVAAWLREEARAACAAGVDRHAAALGLRPGRLTLRDPRSRWGSCTAGGDLMFSWRLVMAPPAVLDYVVAHEVAHLAELNHSARFWAVVRRLCPGMDAERVWLRRNGAALHRYDFGVGPD